MDIYILSDKKIEGTTSLSLLDISYIKQTGKTLDIKSYDALIFTSKNAIYAIDSFNDDWKAIPSYAISTKTAEVLKQYDSNLVFTGTKSHGNDFALELKEELKGKKVLYLRAKKVVSNLVDILKDNDIDCDDLVVYETKCKKLQEKPKLEENSIFIFSSPSTIKCFFENFDWDKSYKAIAIGKTTAKYFPKDIEPIISKETSIESCIEEAKKLLILT